MIGSVKSRSLLTAACVMGLVAMPALRLAADEEATEQPRKVVKSPQQEARDRAEAFRAAAAAKPGVIRTPSGLCYEIIAPGTGDFPKPTDIVTAHYQGTLSNGTVFDSSRARGTPAEFPLNRVIRGWTEGLQKIAKGGKIRLYVPPGLAYGEQRMRGIPAGSALQFEIEILDIRPAP